MYSQLVKGKHKVPELLIINVVLFIITECLVLYLILHTAYVHILEVYQD